MRALLIKGADRMAKDNDGRKPVDYISDNLPNNIKRDLKNMLVSLRFKQHFCCDKISDWTRINQIILYIG